MRLIFLLLFFLPTRIYATEGRPQLKIVSPGNNQTVIGTDVTISFILGDVEFGREAHLHLWIDTDGPIASTAAEVTMNYDHILSDIPEGKHSLLLEAVRPDHTSFSPPVSSSASFTLQYPVSSPSAAPASETGEPERPADFLSSFLLQHAKYVAVFGGILLLGTGVFAYRRR